MAGGPASSAPVAARPHHAPHPAARGSLGATRPDALLQRSWCRSCRTVPSGGRGPAGVAATGRVSSNVTRYAVAAGIAFLLLLGLLLLVRPMIYSVAPPRDDSVYAVATAASVPTSGPLVKELLLNAPHGLLGERRSG